ncbi:hypothetical protein ES703_98610 [subsurface metagenome]
MGLRHLDCRFDKLSTKHLFLMFQGKGVCFIIEGSNTIYRYFNLVISISSVSYSMHDTNISTYTTDDQGFRTECIQFFLKGGIIESTVASFGDCFAGIGSKLRDKFSFGGAFNAVWGKHLELRIIGSVLIT